VNFIVCKFYLTKLLKRHTNFLKMGKSKLLWLRIHFCMIKC
jgi:hypothetical protein